MNKIAAAMGVGIVLGVLTSFGQTYLPEPIKQFANSYSVWLLVSFIFGVFAGSRKQVAISGAVIQITALVSYYAISQLRFEAGFGTPAILLFWLVGGVIIGPFLSLAGWAFASKSKYSMLAICFMTAVIGFEALYLALVLHYFVKSLCFVGLALLFLVGTSIYSRKFRMKRIS